MYLITIEDEDGMWFDHPHGFNSEDEARRYLNSPPLPPDGYKYVLWSCREIYLSPQATADWRKGRTNSGDMM